MPQKRNFWLEYYNSVKNFDWPDCYNEHEFYDLPEYIKKEILDQHGGETYVSLKDDDVVIGDSTLSDVFAETPPVELSPDYDGPVECRQKFYVARDFAVLYDDFMYGNGTLHCQNYPRVLKFLYPDRKFLHCMEWCAGPGFIGYRLLSDGLCDSLTLMDQYRPSLSAAEKTYRSRPARLKNAKINVIHQSRIESIGDQKYDLIVGNPPNHNNKQIAFDLGFFQQRTTQDPEWKIHTEFFLNIKKNLTNDGVILLVKHIDGSQPSDHVDAIDRGGLQISRVIQTRIAPKHYFLEIIHKS